MWFILFSITRPGKVQGIRGYFNCPHCARRQPCSLSQIKLRRYLYGLIPVSDGTPVGPESYRCLACSREYLGDGGYGYDFGMHAEARTWKCFKCGKDVPYERFDCPHCGYQFEVGR
jgi:DNA-directed RNA polymerase subunit RPC12/RpoP